MERRSSSLHWVRVICFVMVTLPNCTRCCPAGFGSCNCMWAWEDCPSSGGCDSCSGSGSAGAPLLGPQRSQSQSIADAEVEEGDLGGTLAFVTSSAKTFLVVSLGRQNEVRAYRLDANALDEDPLTVRPAGLFPFDGERPGRVTTDDVRAIVALRDSGAVVAIDPLLAKVGDRRAVCAAPNALAAQGDDVHVACADGELVTLRISDGAELRRVRLNGELEELAISGDGLVAGTASTLFSLDADANVTERDAPAAVGPLRAWDGTVRAAFDGDIGPLAADGFHAGTHATSTVTDLYGLRDATAFVADGEAWLRASADVDAIPVAEGLAARAVALGDVSGEVTRRVLVVRTVKPSMLVFFTVAGLPSAAAFEPLE